MREFLRKFLAALLTVCALFVLAGAATLGFVRDDAVQAEIATQRAQLASIRQQLVELGQKQKRPAALDRIERSQSLLLPNTSDGSAEAVLQSKLLQMIDRADARAGSIRILPSRTYGELRRMTVAIDIQSDISGLKALLFDMETGNPLMFVDQLEISSATQAVEHNPDRQKPTKPLLNVSLHISSFMPLGES